MRYLTSHSDYQFNSWMVSFHGGYTQTNIYIVSYDYIRGTGAFIYVALLPKRQSNMTPAKIDFGHFSDN